ncbi:hypothetical protein TDB9533_00216 [Thalassocella blandensis]|nr:hypothetical protein TDB9533_00216 [Thalassocella blandensis]
MNMNTRKVLFVLQRLRLTWIMVTCIAIGIAACGGDSHTPAKYRVTVTNATYNQPLSPVAIILHRQEYSGWRIGSAASFGLEDLAESGNPTAFLEESSALRNAAVINTEQGSGILMPGNTEEIDVSGYYAEDLHITIASMLVNTNDAFTGVTQLALADLEVGESIKWLAAVYDAGTEENSETAATVPGPAAGGEGTNAMREVRDIVTRHPGVVTQADGYAESALNESHRFDNGAAVIQVERLR